MSDAEVPEEVLKFHGFIRDEKPYVVRYATGQIFVCPYDLTGEIHQLARICPELYLCGCPEIKRDVPRERICLYKHAVFRKSPDNPRIVRCIRYDLGLKIYGETRGTPRVLVSKPATHEPTQAPLNSTHRFREVIKRREEAITHLA